MLWILPAIVLAQAPEKPTLVGDWKVASVEGDGLAKLLKENVTSIVIESERIIAGRAGEYTADDKKKTIDMTIAGGPKEEQGKYLGVYELTADGLKLHFAMPGKDRPAGFTAKEGSFVIVLKKK